MRMVLTVAVFTACATNGCSPTAAFDRDDAPPVSAARTHIEGVVLPTVQDAAVASLVVPMAGIDAGPDLFPSSRHIMPDGSVVSYLETNAEPMPGSVDGGPLPPVVRMVGSYEAGLPISTANGPPIEASPNTVSQCTARTDPQALSLCAPMGAAFVLYSCPSNIVANTSFCTNPGVSMPPTSTNRLLCCPKQ